MFILMFDDNNVATNQFNQLLQFTAAAAEPTAINTIPN